LNNPGALKDLLDQYKIKPSATYSFRDDPDVVLSWKKAVSDLAHDSPLHLSLPSEPTLADVIEVVRAILTQFKKAIESQRWATFLYKSNGLPQKEGVSQLLFYGIADSYCAANNLDISPEADAGRGPVDFKFSRGYSIRVVVEVKLSSNKQLVHGFTTQTPEYQEAERAGHAFLLVVDVSRSNAWRRRLLKAEANLKLAGNKTPEIVFIDGHVKATASRYHPR
jgi:hypothetical protein